MINHQFSPQTIYQGNYLLSTDADKLDVDLIHDCWSNQSYWAKGVSREKVLRSMQHSLCFGVYVIDPVRDRQVGFARVVTDFATFAYLADVFILDAHRGQGLGKWLVNCILAHPELQELRRWVLFTQDAHTLYTRFGFRQIDEPQNALYFRPAWKEAEQSLIRQE